MAPRSVLERFMTWYRRLMRADGLHHDGDTQMDVPPPVAPDPGAPLRLEHAEREAEEARRAVRSLQARALLRTDAGRHDR